MNTTKEKQITINATEEAKEQFKALKEQYDVTDKDMLHILLDNFKASKEDQINIIITEFADKKKLMTIEAKLARYARKIKMLKESMGETETPETSAEETEDVVFSAEQEKEEVDA